MRTRASTRQVKFKKTAIALTLGLLANQSASGADIAVGISCSLQDAIRSANTNSSVGGCTAGDSGSRDIIMLPASTTFNYAVAEQTAASGGGGYSPFAALPTIESDITIQGAGSTIQRDGAALPFRLIYVDGISGGDLALESLTLQNGYASGPTGIFKAGGAIRSNRGNLSLDNVTVTSNSAERRGGGINVSAASEITIINSTLSSNTAGVSNVNGGGGGISVGAGDHTLTVTGSTITLNNAQYGCGVETYFGTTATFTSSYITNNCSIGSITNSGGGITASDTSVNILSTQITGNSVSQNRGAGIQSFDILQPNDPPIKLEIQSSNISSNLGGPGITPGGVSLYIISSTVMSNGTHGVNGDGPSAYVHSSTLSLNNGTGFDFGDRDSGSTHLIESEISNNAQGIQIYSTTAYLNSVSITDSTTSGAGSITANGSLSLENVDAVQNLSQGTTPGLSARGNIVLANNIFAIANASTSTSGNGGLYLAHTGASHASATLVSAYQNSTYASGGGVTLYADAGSTLTLSNATVSSNTARNGGGGIRVLGQGTTILDTVKSYYNQVSGPTGRQSGAGVYLYRAGSLSIIDSQIYQNTAYGCAGVCSQGFFSNPSQLNISGSTIRDNTGTSGSSSPGGGVGVGYSVNASIDSSTISGNTASSGGGINVEGGSLVATNITVSANTATEQGAGGISKTGNGTVTLTNGTLYGNVQTGGFGVGGVSGGVEINSTVITASIGGDCNQSAFPGRQPVIGDNNWFEDATCNGVAYGAPLLNPLADNGGNTLTHSFQIGSPLIDAGGECGLPVDQLGTARSLCSCDIGAFEVLELRPDNGSCRGSFFVIPIPKNGNTVIIDL